MINVPEGTTPATILEALKILRTQRTCDDSGICWNLAKRLTPEDEWEASGSMRTDISKMVGTLSQDWPRFSEDPGYPVPHPDMGPQAAYLEPDHWDAETEYGRNRLSLLEFLITRFEEEVA